MKTTLEEAQLLSVIDQAASGGYEVVVFTGGEATLQGEMLRNGIRRAARQKLATRLVTNAHWASSEREANAEIRSLVEAGLNEINFSTGDQHARFVPLERIIHAIRAAARFSLTTAVMIESVSERKITREVLESDARYQAIFRAFPTFHVRVDESPWMPLVPSKVATYDQGMTTNRQNLFMRTGCNSVLSTTTVQPDGKIAACCGIGMRLIPELQIGHVDNTTLAAADESASNDFLKRWLRVEGPERILEWASRHDSSIEWEDMYAHRCQACIRLYKDAKVRNVIRDRHQEKMVDVVAAEWLLFHYQPEDGKPHPGRATEEMPT